MTTFCNIMYRKISDIQHSEWLTETNLSRTLYRYNSNKNDVECISYSYFISSYINAKNYIKVKYNYINNFLSGPFYTQEQKLKLLVVFQESQRLYRALCRFAYKWKWRRADYAIKHDLLLNQLEEDMYFVLTLLHAGKKYLFTKSDLTNIIETALTNSPYIYAEPLPIKNPYNNLIFEKSHLYIIYFFMKTRMFVLPMIFHQYFRYNFHLKIFRDNSEAMIRKMYISSIIKTNNMRKLRVDITEMIARYNSQIHASEHIYIDPDFPVDKLIHAMRPLLYLFYTSGFSIDVAEKNAAIMELKYQLGIFQRTSPTFGRKFTQSSLYRTMNPKLPYYTFDTRYNPYVIHNYSKNYNICHCKIIEDTNDVNEHNVVFQPLLPIDQIVPREDLDVTTAFVRNDVEYEDDVSIESHDNDDISTEYQNESIQMDVVGDTEYSSDTN